MGQMVFEQCARFRVYSVKVQLSGVQRNYHWTRRKALRSITQKLAQFFCGAGAPKKNLGRELLSRRGTSFTGGSARGRGIVRETEDNTHGNCWVFGIHKQGRWRG